MKEIKITVSGSCNIGKSRILYHIKNTLKEQGFNVEFGDSDYMDETCFDLVMYTNFIAVIEQIKNNSTIILNESQTQRMPSKIRESYTHDQPLNSKLNVTTKYFSYMNGLYKKGWHDPSTKEFKTEDITMEEFEFNRPRVRGGGVTS